MNSKIILICIIIIIIILIYIKNHFNFENFDNNSSSNNNNSSNNKNNNSSNNDNKNNTTIEALNNITDMINEDKIISKNLLITNNADINNIKTDNITSNKSTINNIDNTKLNTKDIITDNLNVNTQLKVKDIIYIYDTNATVKIYDNISGNFTETSCNCEVFGFIDLKNKKAIISTNHFEVSFDKRSWKYIGEITLNNYNMTLINIKNDGIFGQIMSLGFQSYKYNGITDVRWPFNGLLSYDNLYNKVNAYRIMTQESDSVEFQSGKYIYSLINVQYNIK